MGKLQAIVHKTLGVWVNFEKIKVKENGDVVMRVEMMEEKIEILRGKGKFQGTGIFFYDDLTEREKTVKKWLIQKEKVLINGKVNAWAAYMGIFVNGYKWMWDEVRGKLCETEKKEWV